MFSPHAFSGRSILGFEMGPITPAGRLFDWMFPTLLIWFINGFISVAVLWRVLVSMEPVTENHSKSSIRHWKLRSLAEEAIDRVRKSLCCFNIEFLTSIEVLQKFTFYYLLSSDASLHIDFRAITRQLVAICKEVWLRLEDLCPHQDSINGAPSSGTCFVSY